MGRDIMALLECQSVFFCRGWEKSNGCLLEYHAAQIYGLEIIFEEGTEKSLEKVQNAFVPIVVLQAFVTDILN